MGLGILIRMRASSETDLLKGKRSFFVALDSVILHQEHHIEVTTAGACGDENLRPTTLE